MTLIIFHLVPRAEGLIIMLKIDNNICTAGSAADYVELCEKRYEKKLDDTITSVFVPRIPKVITLSGPTCSGKTTTAAKLTDVIESLGYRARVLSIDDFYKSGLREEEDPDFESVNAIDLDYFSECTERLLNGKRVLLPTFDMKTGMRSALTEYEPHKDDIYIFEGIQAVYPEVTKKLEEYGYVSVFISVAEDVMANGVFFAKDEIRLMRRIVRDDKFRSTSADETLSMWDDVRKNEEKNIFPNASRSYITINSFLPYEVYFIGSYLVPLLETVRSEEHKKYAGKLLGKVKSVTSSYIKESMIPFKSVFREFIG